MAITTKATSNFSFRKLANAFDEVFDGYMEDSYEDLAQFARDNIKNSTGIRKLTKGTIAIRRKGLSKKGYGGATTSTTPLLHTGNLLRSIKATKNGVTMADYGKYHMEGFTISSKNTWNQRFTPKAIGRVVKPRNPFFNAKGDVKPGFKKGADRRMQGLIKKINKVWRI
jgi:hypothetical protein